MVFCCKAVDHDSDTLVIDWEKIEKETKIGKAIKAKLENYMLYIKKQIELLEGYADKSTSAAKLDKGFCLSEFDLEQFKNATDKNRHLMLYSLAQKKSNRVNEISRIVVAEMQRVVKDKVMRIARCRKAKLVLEKSTLFYAESVADISDEVIREVDKVADTFEYPCELKNF